MGDRIDDGATVDSFFVPENDDHRRVGEDLESRRECIEHGFENRTSVDHSLLDSHCKARRDDTGENTLPGEANHEVERATFISVRTLEEQMKRERMFSPHNELLYNHEMILVCYRRPTCDENDTLQSFHVVEFVPNVNRKELTDDLGEVSH